MSASLPHITLLRATSLYSREGIGFAKRDEGNLELMAGLGHLRSHMGGHLARVPLLVGPSRKGFLGRLTGVPVTWTLQALPASRCPLSLLLL